MKSSSHIHKDQILRSMLSKNSWGTYFGVSQKVLDNVWNALTSPAGNSVIYISMEIAADSDTFHPVKDRLIELGIDSSTDKILDAFTNAFLHGPAKIPNYSGGLGVLAGDTLKSFADCKIPVVAISLLYSQGYFSQLVDSRLGQIAWSGKWYPESIPSLYITSKGVPLSGIPHKSSITQVTLRISIAEIILGKEYKVEPGTTVKLMNYEWEFVR